MISPGSKPFIPCFVPRFDDFLEMVSCFAIVLCIFLGGRWMEMWYLRVGEGWQTYSRRPCNAVSKLLFGRFWIHPAFYRQTCVEAEEFGRFKIRDPQTQSKLVCVSWNLIKLSGPTMLKTHPNLPHMFFRFLDMFNRKLVSWNASFAGICFSQQDKW